MDSDVKEQLTARQKGLRYALRRGYITEADMNFEDQPKPVPGTKEHALARAKSLGRV